MRIEDVVPLGAVTSTIDLFNEWPRPQVGAAFATYGPRKPKQMYMSTVPVATCTCRKFLEERTTLHQRAEPSCILGQNLF